MVGHNLGAALATKINQVKLISEIAIHNRGVKSISFATWTGLSLFEPFFEAMIVEYLQAVITLHVFLLDDIETDWAQEGIDEFLVGI